jgi:hypothetical protein
MVKLVEGQPARLDVGESLACRIIGFSGPEVVLALETQPAEEIAGGSSAYLLLESEGRLQALRGESTRPRTARSSSGGVCVARDGDPGDGSIQLTITVANHDVVAEARVVRVTDSDLGVSSSRPRTRTGSCSPRSRSPITGRAEPPHRRTSACIRLHRGSVPDEEETLYGTGLNRCKWGALRQGRGASAAPRALPARHPRADGHARRL